MKKLPLTALITVLSLFLHGCSSTSEAQSIKNEKVTELEEQMEHLKETIQQQHLDLQQYEQQIEEYKALTEQASSMLTKEEGKKLVESLTTTELIINGKSISENGVMTMKSGDVKVVLSQKQPTISFPKSYAQQDKGLLDHISDLSQDPDQTSGKDGTLNVSRSLLFSDVQPNTSLTFSITDDLKRSLGMKANRITIRVGE